MGKENAKEMDMNTSMRKRFKSPDSDVACGVGRGWQYVAFRVKPAPSTSEPSEMDP